MKDPKSLSIEALPQTPALPTASMKALASLARSRRNRWIKALSFNPWRINIEFTSEDQTIMDHENMNR